MKAGSRKSEVRSEKSNQIELSKNKEDQGRKECEPSSDSNYQAEIQSDAAEIHNTLRKGVRVSLLTDV
jgi:hypothetical protein